MSHDEPHLPHGSIWPFWLALAITAMGLGILFFDTMIVPALGLLFLVIVLFGWVKEDFEWWKTNTGTGPGLVMSGLKLFITSEIFIFGALFATYFTFLMQSDHWPDMTAAGHHIHLDIPLTLFFTLFLFASSGTIHQAEKKLGQGDMKGFQRWWAATMILGLIFLAGQANEYITLISEGMGLSSGSYFMTAFYMITGTHGLHVFGGLCYLFIVYLRASKGQFDEKRHVAPATAALYWHFVDVVWVFVFGVLYLIPYFQGAFS